VNTTWNDDQPIYRQLRDRMVAMILEGAIAEGEALPSARTVSAEYRINHLTVLKAYQELADERIVENRRGVGLFVNPGARDRLLRAERRRFLEEEWPRIRATIQRLGLKPQELLRSGSAPSRAKARAR
jgi:GntR family transcriptional regulator